MRDKYGAEQDPYCYPGTTILINLLDLHNDKELAQAEAAFTATQRFFFEQLLFTLGHDITWPKISKDVWVSAYIAGYNGNLQPLADIIRQVVDF
ncbi:hypothetical protein P2G88_01235 [Aliiglaciecola sp. CAU 1673]|uniref:hypothetical protein n=1 Tax=Aliiglaciecola sp. CAU 1673 TaxID=3032595 RepID=UPI0023DAFE2B|nr:hypothetical protein [Aliiglaciecola sp. CAU 1673]MDF2176874.1 hypothetical protein [Aliiglaciecola sp. CAU 1673]